ncbi:MAG: hypothetical protein HQK77_18410 [Desulfobacterales bacterium]|nr:hypothetical protein [Desulfobacterales bacterium]
MSYYLRCPITEEHGKTAHELISKLREKPIPKLHTSQLVDITVTGTAIQIDHYFINPMIELKISPFIQQMIVLGKKTGLSIMSPISKRSYDHMNSDQILRIADFLETFLWIEQKGVSTHHKYYMECPLSESVGKLAKQLVTLIRNNPSPKTYTDKLVQLTVQSAQAQFDFYFIKPMNILNISPFFKRMSEVGIQQGLSIISTVGHKSYDHMSKQQLLKIADYIDQFVFFHKA